MAVFVPGRGWTWTFIGFWLADFVGLLWWMLRGKGSKAFRSPLSTMITALAFFEWFLFSPIAEAVYIWSSDNDPWNNAPYIQWICVNLRTMGIVFGFMIMSAYVFAPSGAVRPNGRAAAIAMFVINAIGMGIVVGYKPNTDFASGNARTPSNVIPITMDWVYVAISFIMFITFMTMVCRRYGLFFDFTRLRSEANVDRDGKDKKLHNTGRVILTTMGFIWLAIFAVMLTYALLLVVRQDQYLFPGSQVYYFHTEYWITRLAPIYSAFFAYPILWAMYIVMWGMDSLQDEIKLMGMAREDGAYASLN